LAAAVGATASALAAPAFDIGSSRPTAWFIQ
jgi:hypothetical protein